MAGTPISIVQKSKVVTQDVARLLTQGSPVIDSFFSPQNFEKSNAQDWLKLLFYSIFNIHTCTPLKHQDNNNNNNNNNNNIPSRKTTKTKGLFSVKTNNNKNNKQYQQQQ